MKENKVQSSILIGNSFPMSLIQRRVEITVVSSDEFCRQISGCAICSFWGHSNTLKAASDFIGLDLTPESERPVVTLSDRLHPVFHGIEFDQCWILSPVYRENFRPQIGDEVAAERIATWQVQKIEWRD